MKMSSLSYEDIKTNLICLCPNINSYYLNDDTVVKIAYDKLSLIIARFLSIDNYKYYLQTVYNIFTKKCEKIDEVMIYFLQDIKYLIDINGSNDIVHETIVTIFTGFISKLMKDPNHNILNIAALNIIGKKQMKNIYDISLKELNYINTKIQMKLIHQYKDIYYLSPFWDDQVDNIDSHNIFEFKKEDLINYISNNHLEIILKDKVFALYLMTKLNFEKLTNHFKKFNRNKQIRNIEGFTLNKFKLPDHIKDILDSSTISSIYKFIEESDINYACNHMIILNQEHNWNSKEKNFNDSRVRYNLPGGKKKMIINDNNEIVEETDAEALYRELFEEWNFIFNSEGNKRKIIDIINDFIINKNNKKIKVLSDYTKIYIGITDVCNYLTSSHFPLSTPSSTSESASSSLSTSPMLIAPIPLSVPTSPETIEVTIKERKYIKPEVRRVLF